VDQSSAAPISRHKAFWQSPESAVSRQRIADKARERWKQPAYRERLEKALVKARAAYSVPTPDSGQKIAAAQRRAWADEGIRARRLAAITPETRRKLSVAQTRVWANMTPEEKDRRTVVLRKRIMGGQYMTTLEARVCTAINELDVWYKFHKVIGRYTADFLLQPNLVVEADGAYWHSLNPEHDATRDAYMAEHGYRVIRIPEQATQAEVETLLREALA
jgi:very-short-patch-repair endonuclease